MMELGLIGMWRDHLRYKDNGEPVPAYNVKLAVGTQLNGKAAVVFLSFANIRHTRTNERLYQLADGAMRPRFSPDVWITDGERLDTKPNHNLYTAALPEEMQGDNAFVRCAPHWLGHMESYSPVADAERALGVTDSAMIPADSGVEYVSAEAQLQKWLRSPDMEDHLPPAITAPKVRLDYFNSDMPPAKEPQDYRLLSLAGRTGVVREQNAKVMRIAYSDGSESWIRRPPGLRYAVKPDDMVRPLQPLFDIRNVEGNTDAYRALKSMWRGRMFTRMGGKEFVRLNFVTRVPLRCPVCFDAVEHDSCKRCRAADGTEVIGQPLVPNLWVRPGKFSARYSGDPEDLCRVIPPIASLPAIEEYLRRPGNRRRRPVHQVPAEAPVSRRQPEYALCAAR
jgi:hypothetical protein